ncbi:MAG: hypothetical protein NTV34_21190, partial [Proteobacteria bacterium]|nr:hypothetical protein [Pseudomonadota bacterium]
MAFDRQFLLLVALIGLVATCGRAPPHIGNGTSPDFPLTDDPDAQDGTFTWDEPDCINGSKLGFALNRADITIWQSPGGSADRQTDLGEVIGSRGFIDSNQTGAPVTARDLYSRRCTNTEVNTGCRDESNESLGWSLRKAGVAPKFCRDGGQYSRDSIERVVLTSLISFKNARDFINGTVLRSNEMSGVELKVLSIFETVWPPSGNQNETSGKRSALVQNLAYFPANGGSDAPFIAVFPRKLGEKDNQPRLWESPFVMAHELGHHVERALGLDHFGNSKRTLVRMAISEAFGDLIGFSATNMDDRGLLAMPCMANRAVSSDAFSDGVAKIIDKALIKSLGAAAAKVQSLSAISWEPNAPSSPPSFFAPQAPTCTSPSRLQPHDLGAIIAHGFYDLFSKSMDSRNESPSARAAIFANSAKNWLESTEKAVALGSTPKEDLQGAARSLEIAVTTYFRSSGQV